MSAEVGTAPQKQTYRSYSDEDKARGIAAMNAVGGRSSLAAIATGFPKTTLEGWVKSERVNSVQARSPDIRLKSEQDIERGLLKVIGRGLKRLNEPDAWERAGVKDAAIATGIAHTHLRLLRSQPTSISETRDLASFLSAAYGQPARVVDTKGKPSEE